MAKPVLLSCVNAFCIVSKVYEESDDNDGLIPKPVSEPIYASKVANLWSFRYSHSILFTCPGFWYHHNSPLLV